MLTKHQIYLNLAEQQKIQIEKIEFNLIDENLYKFKDTKYSKDDIIDLV